MFEKTENQQKEATDDPFKKHYHYTDHRVM